MSPLLVMFVKMLVLLAAVAACGAAGYFAWLLTGGSIAATGFALLVVLAMACVPATWGVARAFAAFDVARDVPA